MTKARDLADLISAGNPLADGAISVSEISDLTATAAELNTLDGITASTADLNNVTNINTNVQTQLDTKAPLASPTFTGTATLPTAAVTTLNLGGTDITATATELNYVDGVTSAVQTQLNTKVETLSDLGVTATSAELNYVDGVTSNIQTQLDNISVTSGSLTKSFASGESATITLTSSVSPTAVVAATKEVSQIGVSSKGTWDVNATASNYDLHNTAYSTTLTPSTIGFNTDLTIDTNKEYYSNLTNERAVRFNNDGTRMYICDQTSTNLREYSLSTPYQPSTATLLNSINNQLGSSSVTGFDIKPDGTKMWFLIDSTDTVAEYDLSPAWNVSGTHSTPPDATQVLPQSPAQPHQLQFSSDGTKVFTNPIGNDAIYEYALSTAWDITSISYTTNFSYTAQTNTIIGFVFSSDGTKLYLGSDTGTDVLYEYELSTGWDVSTASYTGNTFTFGSGELSSLWFEENGTILYKVDRQTHRIKYYDVAATDALILGTGSFASTDVGKNIQGNGGDVILTSTSGAYDATGGSAFTDSSTIASGSWTMSGIKSAGDDDGLEVSYLFNGYASPNLWSYDNSSLETETVSGTTPSFGGSHNDLFMKPDGTRIYIVNSQQHEIYQYNLGTAWDLSTATFGANINFFPENEYNPFGIFFKPDGLVMFVNSYGSNIYKYDLSTAWDLSTATYTEGVDNYQNLSGHTASGGLFFKPDGTKFYVTSSSADNIREYELSTAWDINTLTNNGAFQPSAGTGVHSVTFTSDGTRGFCVMNDDKAKEFEMTTAWDITTATVTSNEFLFTGEDNDARGIFLKDDGSKIYMLDNGAGGFIYQYSSGEIYTASGAYHIAATNSGGQIDSGYWTDLNTMTADETANSGTVHYAVSTDDRTTWSVIDNTNGTRPIVRNNSGTWQFNDSATYGGTTWTNSATNSEFYALQESLADGNAIKSVAASNITDWSYDSNQFNYTQTSSLRGAAWNADFTQVNYLDDMTVRRYNLSTAGDLSTATSTTTTDMYGYSPNNQPKDIFFGDSGNILYYLDAYSSGARTIYQIALSTPYDITSKAGSATNTLDVGNQTANPDSMFFKPDGLRVYLSCVTNQRLYEYTMTTAWDLSTATFTRSGATAGGTHALTFNSDGSVVYISSLSNNKIWAFSLSTPWDASTTSAYFDSLLPNPPSTQPRSLDFNSDHTKLYVGLTGGTPRFARFETANQGNHNRMNKTQLDAVTDPNHYTLGDTLDLMIALRVDSQTNNVPTADGVTINYDAEALNQGAVLGTDYDYDFPANNKVRITSNAAQNLKIRVV